LDSLCMEAFTSFNGFVNEKAMLMEIIVAIMASIRPMSKIIRCNLTEYLTKRTF